MLSTMAHTYQNKCSAVSVYNIVLHVLLKLSHINVKTILICMEKSVTYAWDFIWQLISNFIETGLVSHYVCDIVIKNTSPPE